VFQLLESIFKEFDSIAKRRRIFKVETVVRVLFLLVVLLVVVVCCVTISCFASLDILLSDNIYKQGDCYVAVVGLPDPRKDHAVAMARFAMDCMNKFQLILPKLEVILGPDTADLAMRMGVHSGSVTAGVLRGERSRFQLFGTCSHRLGVSDPQYFARVQEMP
jgi:class 3 adenylate cyclase